MRLKKFLTILLTFAMVVSLLPATAFAANNTATTMRLAKAQGTVTVTNSTGKNVTQTANMKLYNGYKMKTGAKSYAWISLDDTKVAKLDANSTVEVQKSGKALTLYLSSGNMFFNVKDPLKSGESFSIKTSTMTTGIRGTSGCVRVINDRVTEVHLLTGEVQIYTEHPVLDIHKTATLKAGQKATSLIDWEAMAVSGQMAEIVIERLENHEICGICSKEIANDPELLERIEREAPHLLPERAAAEADERLAADEAAAEEKQAEIDAAVAEQVFPEEVDPYFEGENSGGGGGGGSSATVSKVVEVATWGELLQAVKDYNDGSGTTEIRLTADIAAGADDETLPAIADNGALTLNLGTNELKTNGTLVNESNLTITNTAGYLSLSDDVAGGDGAMSVVDNRGTLTLQNGTIVLSETNDMIGVSNSGTFNMKGGAIRSGTVTTENGTSTFAAAGNALGTAVSNSNIANISGGTIEAGTAVENTEGGTLNMTGGTINVTSPDTYGVSSYGNAALSGGTINITENAAGGDTAGGIGVMANGALETTLVMNGTDVYANAGTAVELWGGTVTLAEGSVIHALTPEASAVITAYGDNDSLVVNRPVGAEIIAVTYEEAVDRYDNTVFLPLYTGMILTTEASGDNFKQTLTDNYGKVADPWTLAEAIEQFNMGSGDATITLEADIDMTAEEDCTLPSVGELTDTKVLTLNLNGKTLTLAEQLSNYGNLIITGGTLTGDTDTLIYNEGDLTLAGGTMSMNRTDAENWGKGVYNAGGDLALTGMTINVEEPLGRAVYSEGGTIVIDGSDINVNGLGAMAIETINGAVDVTMTSGTITVAGDSYVEETPDSGTMVTPASGININSRCTLTFEEDAKVLVTGESATGISVGGTMTMTGGSVEVSKEGGYGVDVGGTLVMNDGTITADSAYNARALSVYDGSTAQLNGGTITAKNAAIAVENAYGDETTVAFGEDSMTEVRAEVKDNVFVGELSADYAPSETKTDGTYFYLVAANVDEPEGLTTWAQFVAAVDEFNAGTTEQTIRLDAAITPSDEEAAAATLASIGSDTNDSLLTIDLNGYALTLPQTMTNEGKLKVTGGTISADNTAVTTLIQNSGTLELAAETMNLTSNQTGIANAAGAVTMSGGTINLNNVPSTGILSDGGTVDLTGGEIVLVGCGSNSTNYGINAVNTAVTIDGGTVREGDGIADTTANSNYAVYADGGSLDLKSGEISVHYGQAVGVSAVSVLTLENATVKGKVADNLLVTASGDETGYTTAEYDATYFVLEYEEISTTVATWGEFVTAVADFNDNKINTITLTQSIDPTAAEVEAAGELPAIGNGTTSDLTINLAGNTLALPTTLETFTSSGLVITDDGSGTTEGTLTIGSEWDNSAYLLNNPTTMTLESGKIEVPAGMVGVNNTGTFEMTGGSMDIYYATGIQNTKEVFLRAGDITLVENNEKYSDGGTDAIGYQAYAGSGSQAELEISGTNITIEQGILYYFTDDSGADIYSPPAAVYNETGSTVTFTAGTLTVGSGVGISNNGNLKVDGDAAIGVNEAATATDDTATGIESFGGEFEFTSGTVEVARGTGLKLGATTALDGGMVTAADTAIAVESYTTDVTMADAMTVRAEAYDTVYVTGDGGALPDGYAVSKTAAEDGYYYLEKSEDSNVIEVYDADDMVSAFSTVNSTETVYTIRMMDAVSTENYTDEEGNEVAYETLGVIRGTETTLDLNGNTLTLGNALTNNGTLTITDSGTTGVITGSIDELIVNTGDLTLQGGTMTVASTGISAESGYVLLEGTGINVNGTDATGISVADGAVVEMNVGTSSTSNMISVSSGLGVDVASGGDFTLSSGTIRLNGTSAAGIVNAGNLYLNDGTIDYQSGYTGNAVENSGYAYLGDAQISSYAYTVVNSGEFEMDGGSVASYGNAAIWMKQGSSTAIYGGTVTGGNQYAYALQGPTGWTDTTLQVNVNGATVRAKAADLVITPAHTSYEASETATDTYYTLVSNVEATPVGSEEEFAAAMETANQGVDVTIQLTQAVELTDSYEFTGGETGTSILTIDLAGYDLILNQTLFNNGVMNIIGSGTVKAGANFEGNSADNELIINFGMLTWNDATLHLADAQTGIVTHNTLEMSNCTITAETDAVKENTFGVVYFQGTTFTSSGETCADNVTFSEERLEE